jgi:hypothetical protein
MAQVSSSGGLFEDLDTVFRGGLHKTQIVRGGLLSAQVSYWKAAQGSDQLQEDCPMLRFVTRQPDRSRVRQLHEDCSGLRLETGGLLRTHMIYGILLKTLVNYRRNAKLSDSYRRTAQGLDR